MSGLDTNSLIGKALSIDIVEMDDRFDKTNAVRDSLIEKTLAAVETISSIQNPDPKTLTTLLGFIKTTNDLLNSSEAAIATKITVKSKVKADQASGDIKDELRQMVEIMGSAPREHKLNFDVIRDEINSTTSQRGDVVRESELLTDPTITTA